MLRPQTPELAYLLTLYRGFVLPASINSSVACEQRPGMSSHQVFTDMPQMTSLMQVRQNHDTMSANVQAQAFRVAT